MAASAAALLLATSACKADKDKGVLSMKQMAEVIADMQLAEAYTTVNGTIYNDSLQSIMRQTVLRDHGLTQQDYDRNVSWYAHHIEKHTKLYEEVEKVLGRKQEKMMAGAAAAAGRDGDSGNIWPYSRMAMLSDLSSSDGIAFSLSDPDMKKGERLKWTMHLSNNPGAAVTFGVDYREGGTSFITERLTGEKRMEASLQTDSTKTVGRVYGYFRMTSRSMLPVWADSIAVVVLPPAPELYHKYNSQCNYFGPTPKSEKRDASAGVDSTMLNAETPSRPEEVPMPTPRPGFSAR